VRRRPASPTPRSARAFLPGRGGGIVAAHRNSRVSLTRRLRTLPRHRPTGMLAARSPPPLVRLWPDSCTPKPKCARAACRASAAADGTTGARDATRDTYRREWRKSCGPWSTPQGAPPPQLDRSGGRTSTRARAAVISQSGVYVEPWNRAVVTSQAASPTPRRTCRCASRPWVATADRDAVAGLQGGFTPVAAIG
jgi:hypothetical protein